jgi:hypothetical protein
MEFMTWRKVGIYYALAAVLGAYLAILHGARGPEVDLPTEALEPLVPILATRVTEVSVHWPHLQLRVERDGQRWRTVEPAGSDVTSDLVDAMLDSLTNVAPIELVDESDTRLDEYGLEPAASWIQVSEGSATSVQVELGRHNPTRTAVYAARRDQKRVYLVGLSLRYYVELLREEVERERGSVEAD